MHGYTIYSIPPLLQPEMISSYHIHPLGVFFRATQPTLVIHLRPGRSIKVRENMSGFVWKSGTSKSYKVVPQFVS